MCRESWVQSDVYLDLFEVRTRALLIEALGSKSRPFPKEVVAQPQALNLAALSTVKQQADAQDVNKHPFKGD